MSEGITAELRGFMVTNGNAGDEGGGIINEGRLTLTNSTVSGNVGGIENSSGTLTLINSTVSGNDGGGIINGGGLTLINSTVSGNDGRAIAIFGALTLTNSVTNSVVDGDCIRQGSRRITSGGYNIESPGDTCGFDQPTDQFDVRADDLKLGPLQDNGGPTMTHALGGGSVAIDVIPEAECLDAEGEPLTEDQRGEPRDSMCDVGAFEVQP